MNIGEMLDAVGKGETCVGPNGNNVFMKDGKFCSDNYGFFVDKLNEQWDNIKDYKYTTMEAIDLLLKSPDTYAARTLDTRAGTRYMRVDQGNLLFCNKDNRPHTIVVLDKDTLAYKWIVYEQKAREG